MYSLEIFENAMQNHITQMCMVLFLICGIIFYNNQEKKNLEKVSVFIMLMGIIEYTSAYFGFCIDALSEKISINFLMTISLIIKFFVFLFCVLAATCLTTSHKFPEKYTISLTVLGIMLIICCTLIIPDGAIINILHNLLPAIGFAYLATAFFVRSFRQRKQGAIWGCLVFVFLTYIVATNISETNSYPLERWYSGPIVLIGMAITFLFMMIDEKGDEADELKRKINKYNQRFTDIIQSSPFPIVIVRLSDDSILLANDNFKKLFALNDKDLKLYRFKDFFIDMDNRRLLNSHLEKEKVIEDFEILVRSVINETPFWLSTSANIIDYEYDIAIYAAFQDITDRKKREDLWQTQATRDPLTSLYNRRYFEEEIGRRLFASQPEPFSIFMIDADHFKNVNDTYGHKTGDKVLMALAATAEKALRENDIVARYGGEEFVVYLSQANEEEALTTANRLRESIANIEVEADSGEKIHFTVSIGIATSEQSQDLNELIKMSDNALYKAKEGGRNCCVAYRPELKSEPSSEQRVKEQNNIHPALSADNNVEVSLLDNQQPESQQ